MRRLLLIAILIFVFLFVAIWIVKNVNLNNKFQIGQAIDSLNGVKVYYNGAVDNVEARNTTKDGYNLGLKYQCVEFIKRYYYERFLHKMPDSYGHAKDFFDLNLSDSSFNTKRGLIQFKNPSISKPNVEDIIILKGNVFNRFGHVAIVSKVTENKIEIIQQNPGPFSNSREDFQLLKLGNKWGIDNESILGWLRKDSLVKHE